MYHYTKSLAEMMQVILAHQSKQVEKIASVETSIDEQTIAQAELNAYIDQQAQEIAPEIEIDSTPDRTSGTLYRVWHGSQILGTFNHGC